MSNEISCHSKKSYFTEVHAKSIAQKILEERGQKLRVYACDYCLCFHLTKSELKEYITFCRITNGRKLYDLKYITSSSHLSAKELAYDKWKKDHRIKNISLAWISVFRLEDL